MKMKDQADKTTVDLFTEEKRRGRPVTGQAKTNAQRMREYRQRRKELGVRVVLERLSDRDFIYSKFDQFSRENEHLRQDRDACELLLKQFLNELGDYATCTPCEKWVQSVRDYFGIVV